MEIKQEKVDLETYTDEDMKYEDNLAKERIGQILQDNQKEMQSYVPKVRQKDRSYSTTRRKWSPLFLS